MDNIGMVWSVFLSDEQATVRCGELIGQSIKDGIVMYLDGTLGAGKTTLCRGILQSFGHSGPVKSPTYTLVEPYHYRGKSIYHFDLYRLGDPEELEFMGVRDYFSPQHIALIEWPTRGEGLIALPDLCVNLNPEGEGRKLMIEGKTERGVEVLSSL